MRHRVNGQRESRAEHVLGRRDTGTRGRRIVDREFNMVNKSTPILFLHCVITQQASKDLFKGTMLTFGLAIRLGMVGTCKDRFCSHKFP